jgi:hypothetical protein
MLAFALVLNLEDPATTTVGNLLTVPTEPLRVRSVLGLLGWSVLVLHNLVWNSSGMVCGGVVECSGKIRSVVN